MMYPFCYCILDYSYVFLLQNILYTNLTAVENQVLTLKSELASVRAETQGGITWCVRSKGALHCCISAIIPNTVQFQKLFYCIYFLSSNEAYPYKRFTTVNLQSFYNFLMLFPKLYYAYCTIVLCETFTREPLDNVHLFK